MGSLERKTGGDVRKRKFTSTFSIGPYPDCNTKEIEPKSLTALPSVCDTDGKPGGCPVEVAAKESVRGQNTVVICDEAS